LERDRAGDGVSVEAAAQTYHRPHRDLASANVNPRLMNPAHQALLICRQQPQTHGWRHAAALSDTSAQPNQRQPRQKIQPNPGLANWRQL
jgi:hypothetical protein